MKYIAIILLHTVLILYLIPGSLLGQKKDQEQFRIVFYNTENLFDTENDPDTDDDEFTPDGNKKWTTYRYNQKTDFLSRALITINGELVWPDIIGLVEIENREVLNHLTNNLLLRHIPYHIIHRESPDPRGIDAAFIFRADRFTVLSYGFIPLTNYNNYIVKSRETVYVKGLADNTDTLHFFVCHWPSRIGGNASINLRLRAGELIKHKTDSINMADKNARIIIMGDFNDTPNDESITKGLGAMPLPRNRTTRKKRPSNNTTEGCVLYNISSARKSPTPGTYKYRAQWDILDQFIVSLPVVTSNQGFYATSDSYNISSEEFLFEKDPTNGGDKPFRTYQGPVFKGGYSDHLPVRLTLHKK